MNNKDTLSHYLTCNNQFITVGDGKRIRATGKGILHLEIENGIITNEALYVPEIKVPLLSIAQIAKEGVITTFDKEGITFTRQNRVIGSGHLAGEDYLVTGRAIKDYPARVVSASYDEYWKWHTRLGHIGKEKMKALMEQGLIETIPIPEESCPTCTKDNLRRQSHPPICDESTQKGTIFADIWGPVCLPSGMDRYFLVIVHSETRKVFLQTMQNKSQAAAIIQQVVRYIDHQYGPVTRIHTDCGGGICGKRTQRICRGTRD
jgi:hypothetical protein